MIVQLLDLNTLSCAAASARMETRVGGTVSWNEMAADSNDKAPHPILTPQIQFWLHRSIFGSPLQIWLPDVSSGSAPKVDPPL